MAAKTSMKRLDSRRVRLVAAMLGAILGILWVVGLSTGATFWLAWMIALAALACFGTTSLVPEQRAGVIAAPNLGLVAAGLAACWIIGLLTSATGWLVWCCFAGALAALSVALGAGLTAVFDLF